MNKEDRCIATSADSRYLPALMALLRSLERTNGNIPVTVFDGGLTRRQCRKTGRFAGILRKRPFLAIKGRGKFSYIGDTTLLKFEVANLPHEKVLYLDADMVVLEPLDGLFSFPEGKVGVVPEINSVKNMFRLQHREVIMNALDIPWDKPGFNAGLFALRPAEWRDLPERVMHMVERFGPDMFSKSKDQQLLNVIFNGHTFKFPGRYNFSPFYDNIEVDDPAVIHYLSERKPWQFSYPEGHFHKKFRDHIKTSDFPEILTLDVYRALLYSGWMKWFMRYKR